MLRKLFPFMPPEHDAEAYRIYLAVFDDLPLEGWERQGTLIVRYVNGRKLNFAARRTHCTLGFRGHAAVEFYRFAGGSCPVGEVTIKIPYYREFDPGPVREAIDWYAHNQPLKNTAGEVRWP